MAEWVAEADEAEMPKDAPEWPWRYDNGEPVPVGEPPDSWTPPPHPDPTWRKVMTGTTTWLSAQEWHTFATLTYRQSVSTDAARRSMERWLRTANVRLAWWVTERGDRFGRIHNHALLQFNRDDGLFGQLAADQAEAAWRRKAGHTAFRRYDPNRGAAGYLAAYVLKKVTDYDLWLPQSN